MDEIAIGSPKKISESNLAGAYACDVYLPDMKKKYPIYAGNPTDAANNASKFVKAYLEEKIKKLEFSLNAKDIKQKLLKDLEWSKQELAKHERKQG